MERRGRGTAGTQAGHRSPECDRYQPRRRERHLRTHARRSQVLVRWRSDQTSPQEAPAPLSGPVSERESNVSERLRPTIKEPPFLHSPYTYLREGPPPPQP